MRKDITEKILRQLYVVERKNCTQIAKILNCSLNGVLRKIKEFKIDKRKTKGFRHLNATLTDTQIQILNGALLGDGMIEQKRFVYASKSNQHVYFVWNYFRHIMSPKNKNNLSVVTQYDKRTEKSYTRYFFNSQSNQCFEDIHKCWYVNRKQIPNNLVLTPLTCLVWYLGDGSLNSVNYSISFATDSFSRELLDFLCRQLKSFSARMVEMKKHGKIIHRIHIPRKKAYDFLRYIGDCPFKDYAHKWNIPPYKYKKFLTT